jgi:hypothetical protein
MEKEDITKALKKEMKRLHTRTLGSDFSASMVKAPVKAATEWIEKDVSTNDLVGMKRGVGILRKLEGIPA